MKALLALLSPMLLLVSCVNTTPQGRIERNPHLYAGLSDRDKSLVRQGMLARGMSKDAVWLAWGSPAEQFDGTREGKAIERWVYTRSEPVYTTNFIGGYGTGYGRWAGYPYRYRSYGFGFGPEISYVPQPSASVTFLNRRVDSWERRR